MMKNTMVIVNTTGGGIIDEAALYDAAEGKEDLGSRSGYIRKRAARRKPIVNA